MKEPCYEVGTVGVESDVSACCERGAVSSDYVISQRRVASAVSWLRVLPSSRGWPDGMLYPDSCLPGFTELILVNIQHEEWFRGMLKVTRWARCKASLHIKRFPCYHGKACGQPTDKGGSCKHLIYLLGIPKIQT
jgi:hypothetical protein